MDNAIAKLPIVMLANGHTPFDTRIFLKEAVSLSRNGYNVSIIVPTKADDSREGVKIISVPFTAKGWQKLLISPFRILRKALSQPRGAVYHIHDSDILLVGVILKIFGRKVIYDAHEDTPLQISYQHWIPTLMKGPYKWFYYLLEKLCGLMFDKIIVAEPVIAKYFPISKTTLIRNFPSVKAFKREHVIPYEQRQIRMVSLGTLSRVRGLFEMVEGAAIARKQIDFDFVLGGKFAPVSLEKKIKDQYPFTYLEWLPHNDLVDLLFNSRIGIIVPNPIERYRTNYPVKLFEFMAAGIPVIASKEGESAHFVNEGNCGILVDSLNVNEIADAIVWLLQHPEEAGAMGRRGQKLIFDKYNWEKETESLISVYSDLN